MSSSFRDFEGFLSQLFEMPRNEMCSNIDPIKLQELNIPHEFPILKNEENLCKYPFIDWCPPHEKSCIRARSQSECLEPCKKRCRETKSYVKKYLESQEYENMDLEYELSDDWFEKTHQRLKNQPYECPRMRSSFSETKEHHQHQYYDCCGRLRSNLCELPTSYIRNVNNHQNQPKMSGESDSGKDYAECLENRVNSYEKNIKYVDYSEDASVLEQGYERSQKRSIQARKTKMEILKNNISDTLSVDNHHSPAPQMFNKDQHKHCQTEDYPNTLAYETQTYFDKNYSKNEKQSNNLSEIYSKEIDRLKGKLEELRNSAYRNNTSAEMVAESLVAKDDDDDDEMEQKKKERYHINKPVCNRDSPKMLRRNRSTRMIRVKTKGGRVLGTVKIRRSNAKTNLQPSKSNLVESEDVQSEYSDSDESLKETEEDTPSDDFGLEDSTNRESLNSVEGAGSGDATAWPIRESVFPNVAPYIVFNSFDAEEVRKIPIGRKFFKWKLSTITPVLVRKVITNSGFVMVRSEFTRESNQWLGTWGKHIKSPMFKTLKDTQKLNHFPGTFQLGRKDRLWRNFQRMMNAHGNKEFGFLPHTYVLPHELKLLKYNWENKNTGGDWWIIKPPASARGVGIKVINRWAQLPKKTSLVVQKYITNPYLINGSKFDLRLYVLVTSFNPLRVYLYADGLVRFASVKYSSNAKDIKEKYMHLTNYSINKLSSNYTANEDAHSAQGHKWTITKLLEYLGKEGVDVKTLWKNLEMLVVKTMIACESPITDLCNENMSSRYNCYELFGIDVLLDSKLKPWLLEVNISPSLHSSSPLDEHVKGPMVRTLFNMAQFHFPSRLAAAVKPEMKCYDPKLYTTCLTAKELAKHCNFEGVEKRTDYLEGILENLTGDDVRHLIQAEDELRVKDKFKRIFPNASTHKLLNFMEPRYYNRLFDAWESKYEKNREEGIRRLQGLCKSKVHIRGVTLPGIQKNGQATSRGGRGITTSQKEKTTKDVPQNKDDKADLNKEPSTIVSTS